jgi:hypothetical protein
MLDVFRNSALIVQIALNDSFQAMGNGYLGNLSNLNAQIAVSERTKLQETYSAHGCESSLFVILTGTNGKTL